MSVWIIIGHLILGNTDIWSVTGSTFVFSDKAGCEYVAKTFNESAKAECKELNVLPRGIETRLSKRRHRGG